MYYLRSVRLYLQLFVGGAHVLFTFGSSLPPVVCRRAHVLFTFGSSLPPVVCRRTHVLFTFGSSLPPVVCRRAHVLFTFGSSLPPVVCRRAHVLFTFDSSLPCLHLVYPLLPVSLDCPYLIAPSLFSIIIFISYLLKIFKFKFESCSW